jgi:hypothetical protein
VVAGDIFVHHTGGPLKADDATYTELVMNAWEIYKKKWGLGEEVQYGQEYDVDIITAQPFDPALHKCPL